MKIISSFMDDINLIKGEYHTITFESSYLQQIFRKLISNYYSNTFKDEQTNSKFLEIVKKDSGTSLKKNDIQVINFNCNIIDLTVEKDTNTLLFDYVLFMLENNTRLLEEYLKLNESMEKFTNSITLKEGNLKIEFESTKKTMQSLLKSLTMHFEYEEKEYIPNYILREYLIKSLLMLNRDKEILLIMSYPETDIGREDFINAIESIKKLNITTLVISSEHDFVISANPNLISLVDKNGRLYDVKGLLKEMEVFGISANDEFDTFAKSVAFYDFTSNTSLLSLELKEFLESYRF